MISTGLFFLVMAIIGLFLVFASLRIRKNTDTMTARNSAVWSLRAAIRTEAASEYARNNTVLCEAWIDFFDSMPSYQEMLDPTKMGLPADTPVHLSAFVPEDKWPEELRSQLSVIDTYSKESPWLLPSVPHDGADPATNLLPRNGRGSHVTKTA